MFSSLIKLTIAEKLKKVELLTIINQYISQSACYYLLPHTGVCPALGRIGFEDIISLANGPLLRPVYIRSAPALHHLSVDFL